MSRSGPIGLEPGAEGSVALTDVRVSGHMPTASVPPKTRLPDPRDRIPLGSSGVEASPVCVGLTDHPDTYCEAFDAGINFFFLTSDMHWPLYEGARQALVRLLARGGGVRDQIVVAAACYPTQPEFCTMPFSELVDAVPGLGHIDVLVAGGAYAGDWTDRRRVYAAHRDERFEGARAVGASFHERAAVAPAVTAREVDIAYVRYNPLHLGARRDIFPQVPDGDRAPLYNFKSSIGWRPPEQYEAAGHGDLWLPTIGDHYRFALTPPAMDGLLCMLGEPSHIGDLIDALAEGPLDDEDQNHLIALSRLELD